MLLYSSFVALRVMIHQTSLDFNSFKLNPLNATQQQGLPDIDIFDRSSQDIIGKSDIDRFRIDAIDQKKIGQDSKLKPPISTYEIASFTNSNLKIPI